MRAKTRILSVAATLTCLAAASPAFAQTYIGGSGNPAVEVDLDALNSLPGSPAEDVQPARQKHRAAAGPKRAKSANQDGDFQTVIVGGGSTSVASITPLDMHTQPYKPVTKHARHHVRHTVPAIPAAPKVQSQVACAPPPRRSHAHHVAKAQLAQTRIPDHQPILGHKETSDMTADDLNYLQRLCAVQPKPPSSALVNGPRETREVPVEPTPQPQVAQAPVPARIPVPPAPMPEELDVAPLPPPEPKRAQTVVTHSAPQVAAAPPTPIPAPIPAPVPKVAATVAVTRPVETPTIASAPTAPIVAAAPPSPPMPAPMPQTQILDTAVPPPKPVQQAAAQVQPTRVTQAVQPKAVQPAPKKKETADDLNRKEIADLAANMPAPVTTPVPAPAMVPAKIAPPQQPAPVAPAPPVKAFQVYNAPTQPQTRIITDPNAPLAGSSAALSPANGKVGYYNIPSRVSVDELAANAPVAATAMPAQSITPQPQVPAAAPVRPPAPAPVSTPTPIPVPLVAPALAFAPKPEPKPVQVASAPAPAIKEILDGTPMDSDMPAPRVVEVSASNADPVIPMPMVKTASAAKAPVTVPNDPPPAETQGNAVIPAPVSVTPVPSPAAQTSHAAPAMPLDIPSTPAVVPPPAPAPAVIQTAALAPPPSPPAPSTPIALAAPKAPPAGSNGNELSVDFAAGSPSLPSEATSHLDALSGRLKSNPDLRVELRSFASAAPDMASKARRLSLSRALEIKSYLVSQGIAEDRIDVRALGAPPGQTQSDRIDFFLMR